MKLLYVLTLFASCAFAADIPNLSEAGPDMLNTMPKMYFGVKSCGEYVVWLVFADDIRRIDKDHEPADMKEFMQSLERSHIPGDVKVIDCATAL